MYVTIEFCTLQHVHRSCDPCVSSFLLIHTYKLINLFPQSHLWYQWQHQRWSHPCRRLQCGLLCRLQFCRLQYRHSTTKSHHFVWLKCIFYQHHCHVFQSTQENLGHCRKIGHLCASDSHFWCSDFQEEEVIEHSFWRKGFEYCG